MSSGAARRREVRWGGELYGRACSLGSWFPAVGDPLRLSLSGLEDARLLLRALAAGEALNWGWDMCRPFAFRVRGTD